VGYDGIIERNGLKTARRMALRCYYGKANTPGGAYEVPDVWAGRRRSGALRPSVAGLERLIGRGERPHSRCLQEETES
jgi:hypothetical protein